jgi:hypothetical protein
MLIFGSKTVTVDGITVFADHADPNQFWYLPGPVTLARGGPDEKAEFSFIKYKPAAVAGGAKGGGFLMFKVNLQLDPALEGKILSAVSSGVRGEPKLSAVQFDEGSVQCTALNLQGSGGTISSPAGAGTFNAVEKILGASVPSLFGDNSAAFSLTLSQEGAIIVEKAFKEGLTPVGVIYNLKFTGLRPALDVKITADFKRIYDQFSASLSGQYYFFKAGIDIGFENLVQNGAIKIEVTNYTTEGDKKEKEKWALDFFKDKLLNDWFEPTLSPGKLSGESPQKPEDSTTGTKPSSDGKSSSDSKSTPSTPSSSSATPGGGASTTVGPSPGSTGGQSDKGTGAAASADTRKPAAMVIESTDPSPLPGGYGISHVPSSSGTSETLTISGGNNPLVQVDGVVQQLDSQRHLSIDVPAGSIKKITVDYPSSPDVNETFNLFFDFENPLEQGWSTSPPSKSYSGYLNNAPDPQDGAFSGSAAPSGGSGSKGADGLRSWIKDRLVSPKEVSVDAHASYEGKPEKLDYNQKLSERRRDVAVGVISNLASISSATASGQTEAQAANRVGDSMDRVARIKGKTAAGSPRVKIQATISRPLPDKKDDGKQGDGKTDGGKTDGGKKDDGGAKPSPNTPQGTSGDPAISLKIKFIKQEELKTVTLEYHSSEAAVRTYAPQGFFGLLLGDQDKHFLEVDLDDPFFRIFAVTVDAPIDFSKIGLNSAHVSVDYGNPADEANHKHGDFIFDAQNKGQKKFEVFMNKALDTSYSYEMDYNFDPQSGWDGQSFSYHLPARKTEDRTLNLNPYDDIGFLEIKILSNNIDWGVLESIDVNLNYQDQGDLSLDKSFTLTPDSVPQFWKLRLSDPKARSYSYSFVYHMKDGSTKKTNPVTTRALVVPVDDPFVGALDIEFIPLFDPARVRMAFIDIEYKDSENNYEREERLKLAGNATDSVKLRISLVDPKKRKFSFRFTFVDTNNQMNRGPFVETEETLIGVSE